MDHEETRHSLDALFVGDPMDADPLSVRRHLRECVGCREYFGQLAAVDHALDASRTESSGSERDFGFSAAYTDAIVVAEVETLHGHGRVWKQRKTFLIVTAAAAALLLAVGGALLVHTANDNESEWVADGDDGLRPRSEVAPGEGRQGIRRLEVFCLRSIEGRIEVTEAKHGELHCDDLAELKFAFTNAPLGAEELPYLTLLTHNERGEVDSYCPAPRESADTDSMWVGESGRLRPLGETIRLDSRSRGDVIEVVAVFSAEPIPRADVLASSGAGTLAQRVTRHLASRRSLVVEGVTIKVQGQ